MILESVVVRFTVVGEPEADEVGHDQPEWLVGQLGCDSPVEIPPGRIAVKQDHRTTLSLLHHMDPKTVANLNQGALERKLSLEPIWELRSGESLHDQTVSTSSPR